MLGGGLDMRQDRPRYGPCLPEIVPLQHVSRDAGNGLTCGGWHGGLGW